MKLERGYKTAKVRKKDGEIEKKKLTVMVNARKEENVANLGSKLMQN